MMKKKSGIIFYCLLFLMSFLGEIYCMLRFRNDWITVIGIGIVVLIAAYLLLDTIFTDAEMNPNQEKNQNNKGKKNNNEIKNDIDLVNKAIYVAVKKNTESIIKAFEKKKRQDEYNIQKIIEINKMAVSTIVKYEKEMTEQMIQSQDENSLKIVNALKDYESDIHKISYLELLVNRSDLEKMKEELFDKININNLDKVKIELFDKIDELTKCIKERKEYETTKEQIEFNPYPTDKKDMERLDEDKADINEPIFDNEEVIKNNLTESIDAVDDKAYTTVEGEDSLLKEFNQENVEEQVLNNKNVVSEEEINSPVIDDISNENIPHLNKKEDNIEETMTESANIKIDTIENENVMLPEEKEIKDIEENILLKEAAVSKEEANNILSTEISDDIVKDISMEQKQQSVHEESMLMDADEEPDSNDINMEDINNLLESLQSGINTETVSEKPSIQETTQDVHTGNSIMSPEEIAALLNSME